MLKVANWNLERVVPNQVRATRVCEAISEISADIWVLTETHAEIGPASFFSVTSDEPDRESKAGERWAAIWTCHPIESLNEYVSDLSRCTAAKVTHPQLGVIIVYALVLPWGGSSWKGIPSRGGAAFAAALATYQTDWEQLQNAYPDATFIIAGDFNQSLASWHYYGSNRNRSKLETAVRECGIKFLTAGENDPIARDSSPCACIDHICMTSQRPGKAISTQRWPATAKPDKRLSDHFGVVVEVSG